MGARELSVFSAHIFRKLLLKSLSVITWMDLKGMMLSEIKSD